MKLDRLEAFLLDEINCHFLCRLYPSIYDGNSNIVCGTLVSRRKNEQNGSINYELVYRKQRVAFIRLIVFVCALGLISNICNTDT